MADCDRTDELVLDYLEGSLASEDLGLVKQHLEGCSRCAEKVDSYQSILSSYRAMPDEEVGPDLAGRVREAARAAISGPAGRWRLLPILLPAAAVLVALAWVGLRGENAFADHLRSAERHQAAGELEDARSEYERALELADGAGAAAVLHALGSLHLELEEYDRARTRLTTLAELYPDYPERREALLLRAEALIGLGETGLAIEVYDLVAREFGDEDASRRARELAFSESEMEALRALGYVE